MKCAHCGHGHVNPVTGTVDIDRCFDADQDNPGDWAEFTPCPCVDFDH
jgi:hypothetical protein